ncbi:Ger(x)C family spore germination protein [Niallia taxi]|uniref:Ger(x)C family spore germination protein n=1 Tax=Niallia taxi TaxID=2499688 RepID=UPI003009CD4D
MKKIFLLCLLSLMTILLTGCWSNSELNEIAIASAIGIDKTDNGYQVSVQIINPGELAGERKSGRSEVSLITKEGKTIFETLRKLSMDAPRKIYVAHIRTIIFGEDMAKEGIGKALDFLTRDHDMRSDFLIAIAKGSTAKELLNIQSPMEIVPGEKINKTIKNTEKSLGITKAVTIDGLITDIHKIGKEPVLTGIHFYGDPKTSGDLTSVQSIIPKSGITVDSIGVLKTDKLLGWLNEEESIGFNYTQDNISNLIMNVPCKDAEISIETINSTTNLKALARNGKPVIQVNIFTNGVLGDVECNMNLSSKKNLDKITDDYEKVIKEKVENVIINMQETYQSDIFGFGEVIHQNQPKIWKEVKGNWQKEFADLDVKVTVKANIRRIGAILDDEGE